MVALLILPVDVFVEAEVVFEGFSHLGDGGAVENLVVQLEVNLRTKVQIALELSDPFLV